jgi:hypothetical protein
MPKTTVVIYQETDGRVPLREWLVEQDKKVQDKCVVAIEILADRGYELRRPVADYLRDGVYELRVRYGHMNYRILYGFCGANVVLLSHGCTKEAAVPAREIERAIMNLKSYKGKPVAHTYFGEL